jgi:hypothetical protein
MTDKPLILVFLSGLVLFGISFLVVFSETPWVHPTKTAHSIIEDWEPVYPDHPDSNVKCLIDRLAIRTPRQGMKTNLSGFF